LERKLEMKPDAAMKLKLEKLLSKKSIFIKNVSFWKKLVYPLVVLMLIILPIFSILISGYHVLEILYTEKIKTIKNTNWMTMLFFSLLDKLYFLDGGKQSGNEKLGVNGLSFFGPIGTIVEAVLVPYLYISSVYGFYTWKVFKKLRPVKSESSLHLMIINCFIVLSLSSALPLMCRILDFVEPHETINPSDGNTLVDQNINLVLIFNGLFVTSTTYTCVSFLQKNMLRLIRTAKSIIFQNPDETNLPTHIFSPNSSFIKRRSIDLEISYSQQTSFTEEKLQKITNTKMDESSFNESIGLNNSDAPYSDGNSACSEPYFEASFGSSMSENYDTNRFDDDMFAPEMISSVTSLKFDNNSFPRDMNSVRKRAKK